MASRSMKSTLALNNCIHSLQIALVFVTALQLSESH